MARSKSTMIGGPGEWVEKVDADRILELVEAGLGGDFNGVRRLARLIVDSYSGAEGERLRKRLDQILHSRGRRAKQPAEIVARAGSHLLEQPSWPSEPLFLSGDNANLLTRILDEAQAADRLAEAGLAARSNCMLAGPPGTGKTTIAGHIAARLGRPFNVLRLDAVVSSMLGDTARNLRAAFDYAKADGFLFLDEVDAIAKYRDDARDVGELKRVVNAFIQALDSLPLGCVIIAATNHAHLLDPAIWRRFPYQVEVGLPEAELREQLWAHYLALPSGGGAMARVYSGLAKLSEGMSGSDIREIAHSARRMALLDGVDVDIAGVTDAVIRSRPGRLAVPRRMGSGSGTERVTLRDALSLEDELTPLERAALRNVSPSAQYEYEKGCSKTAA